MVLVDTSVWVSHFRRRNPDLEALLLNESVLCHPLIIGELACGNLHGRQAILSLLKELPQAPMAGEQDVFIYLEHHALAGKGLGIVDVHLLVSASLAGVQIWTEDKAMRRAAGQLKMLFM